MPNPRVAHCVFCDDIRTEVGNKASFMGVYVSDLYINQPFPAVLQKLCAIIWLISDPDDPPTQMTTTIILPDGVEFVRMESPQLELPDPFQMMQTAQKAILSQTVQCCPLPLPSEGMLEVWVETDREKLRAGRLWVHTLAALVSDEAGGPKA